MGQAGVPEREPYKHNLTIDSMEKGSLEASVSLPASIGVKLAALAVSSAILGLAMLAVLAGNDGNRFVMFAGIALAIFGAIVEALVLGFISSVVHLSIDESHIRFRRDYTWFSSSVKGSRKKLEYVKCWSDTDWAGSGRGGYLVCLHFGDLIRPVCVYSKRYTERSDESGIPSQDEALDEARAKADEIAECLGVDSR